MKKEIIKPFDLEAYNKGAKIKTRDGHEARIICTDAKDKDYPIVALMTNNNGIEVPLSYTYEGKFQVNDDTISKCDLVIVEEIEEQKFWSDREDKKVKGYYIDYISDIINNGEVRYNKNTHKLYANRKQAKAALAMARISQIMTNDIENFGGPITDEEWKNDEWKFVIYRMRNNIKTISAKSDYYFLAFHTEDQRDLFLEKYHDLVKDYLMINYE